MSETSRALLLAEHIFDTVWQRNNLLSAEDLWNRNIRTSRGHMTNTYQVLAFGNRNDPTEPLWEVLTKRKDGRYQLEANPCFGYTGDPELLKRIRITENSPEEHLFRLAGSILVRELANIAAEIAFPDYAANPS